eukprot:TRINITY_DN2763_c0_g1_i1.p1 TRINITY_DN2763_c0_g1~~TRINITY_DN2763_c0_g1_i1.p1  ORF type:complete len:232 (-),score=79.39 TRINITY_DN2763_c0_g1_i1:181-876(-)
MIRRPPRSTHCISSAASDVYKRQYQRRVHGWYQRRVHGIKQCILDNVDITWFDKYLNNAIHMASANGHINVLDILFDQMKKLTNDQQVKMINQINSDGNTPLHWAVLNNSIHTVEYLVAKNVDTSIKNQNNRTPFEEAVELEKGEIAEFLAKHTKPDLDSYKDVENENFQVPITKDDEQDDDDNELYNYDKEADTKSKQDQQLQNQNKEETKIEKSIQKKVEEQISNDEKK